MGIDKKGDNIFSRLEKFSIPAILVLTFAIGGSHAVSQQTMSTHTDRLNHIESSDKNILNKINEIEKVPIKYDEQIKNLAQEQKLQQELTNQNIRDLRGSVERTNELIIKILDKKK